jgi:hypothetical protein
MQSYRRGSVAQPRLFVQPGPTLTMYCLQVDEIDRFLTANNGIALHCSTDTCMEPRFSEHRFIWLRSTWYGSFCVIDRSLQLYQHYLLIWFTILCSGIFLWISVSAVVDG